MICVVACMKRVFLSSTFRDLEDYRKEVYDRVNRMAGLQCVRFENFGARDALPIDECIEEVATCDIFVGIIGHYHGSRPKGSSKSITEHEYDEAKARNIPRLMFLAAADFAVAATIREDDAANERQKEFRKRVDEERVRDCFSTVEDLKSSVVTALHNHLAKLDAPKLNLDFPSGKYVIVLEGPPADETFISHVESGYFSVPLPNLSRRHIVRITTLHLGGASGTESRVFDFTDGTLPPEARIIRNGHGSYYPAIGAPLSVAVADEPRFEEVTNGVRGLLIERAATNLLIGSGRPKSQTCAYVEEGEAYVLWVVGSGAAVLTGATEGRATEGRPVIFTPGSSKHLNVTVEGYLSQFQLETGDTPTSFIAGPEGAIVTRVHESLYLRLPQPKA